MGRQLYELILTRCRLDIVYQEAIDDDFFGRHLFNNQLERLRASLVIINNTFAANLNRQQIINI